MTTLDKYLSAVLSGDISGLPEPQTNIEKYLAAALGVWDGDLPTPLSNADAYLYKIAQQGISGGTGEGGVVLPALTNPATVAMIRAGYQAINASGKVITGTMPEHAAVAVILDSVTTSHAIEAGYHAAGSVSVELEEIAVEPSTEVQEITPTEGKLISKVTVQAAASGGGDDSGSPSVHSEIITRTVTEIDDSSITEIGSYGLAWCRELIKATFRAVEKITGNYAFAQCSILSELNLPVLKEANGYMIQYCNALKHMELPVLEKVPTYCFQSGSLTFIDFGAITEIMANAFASCSNLATIIIRTDSVCKLSSNNAFTGTPFASGKAGGTIYVPAALVEEYKAATNWSTLVGYGTCNFMAIEGSEYE